LGSRNPNNVVKATMDGLKQLRTVEQFAAKRGITVAEVFGLDKKVAPVEEPAVEAVEAVETPAAPEEQKETQDNE
jgi:hypothetical protein